jgi:hypothetical protein
MLSQRTTFWHPTGLARHSRQTAFSHKFSGRERHFVLLKRVSNRKKITVSIFCGLLVGASAAGIHWFLVPHDRVLLSHVFLADLVAALTAIIVCLGIQLRQEEVHYASAMSRTAIVTELNHHVRNAVFPLCLAVQKTGDSEALQVASDAVDRINVALREATADAISGRVSYADNKNGNALAH